MTAISRSGARRCPPAPAPATWCSSPACRPSILRPEILVHAPFERQVELILEQIKKALEAAGSDLDHVLKCNVLCISADRFKAFNEVYKRYFPKNPPARIFFCVPEWTGPFDVEVDCVAVTKD